MLVSAVVCTHSLVNLPKLLEAVGSLLRQTYRNLEIIIVVDGNRELYEKTVAYYREYSMIQSVLLDKSSGISGARNAGISVARGDVIAFMDDDALALGTWIETLVSTYEGYNALAVGGKVLPLWIDGKTECLPEELYWLVGITHEGFAAEKITEVRNTFGPNMSYKREVFEQIGLFNEALGFAKGGSSYLQAEEPEFALRMREKFGRGVIYNPGAIVYHRISRSKTGVIILLRRSFYQGYSKAMLRRLNISSDSIATEKTYLKDVFFRFAPRKIKHFYRVSEMKKLALLVASVFIVGIGFVYGYSRELIVGWIRR